MLSFFISSCILEFLIFLVLFLFSSLIKFSFFILIDFLLNILILGEFNSLLKQFILGLSLFEKFSGFKTVFFLRNCFTSATL